MQKATTILNALQKRGQYGLQLENGLYRQLYNPDLYYRAYGKIYSNQGSLTPGIDNETVDGMTKEKISNIINALRREKYWWKPTRRVYIPKANGTRRALGLPKWTDKLLQEVIRSLLDAYYEPQFSDASHGFRPARGCHTALVKIHKVWAGTKWWIEGDIKGCFDNIDHKILMDTLGRNIKDNRFLTLIRRFLDAGCVENGKLVTSMSGTPQGGILSPLLSNIYLHELDKYVETTLQPTYTQGKRRRGNREYMRLTDRRLRLRKKGDYTEEKELTAKIRQVPSLDPLDPHYRRLRYIRYADDFLLGFIGTKQEALKIKGQLTQFLRDNLKLDLSDDKTLISHARTQPASFLGYEIIVQGANDKTDHRGRRNINGQIGLRVPQTVINKHCAEYMRRGRPASIPMLTLESDYAIVNWYGKRLTGITQYYKLAHNMYHLWKLVGVMQRSLLFTLAHKHRKSTREIWLEHRSVIDNGTGRAARCIVAVAPSKNGKKLYVARFGGISLSRDKNAVPQDITLQRYTDMRSDLLDRLQADICELCEQSGRIEIHHIRALKDLNVKGRRPKKPWQIKMAAMQRKTLAVCQPCHRDITHGRY